MSLRAWFWIFASQVVLDFGLFVSRIRDHQYGLSAVDLAFVLVLVLFMTIVCMDEDEEARALKEGG